MTDVAQRETLGRVQCPICMEDFTKPKVLTCKHVFCCQCLVKWKKESEEYDVIKCPLCNEDHHMVEGERVEDLSEPLLILNFLETCSFFLTSATSETIDHMCDACAGTKTASFICRSCLKTMCDACKEGHSTLKDHVVIKLSKRTLCQSHEGQLRTLYCTRCQSAICQLCYETRHQGHRHIVKMETVLAGKIQKLVDFRKSAEAISASLHESDTESFIKRVESGYCRSLRQLDEEADSLSAKLQDTQLLKRKIKMKRQDAKIKLSTYRGEIQDAIATNESLQLYIDDILTKGHDVELISCADELPEINENYDIEKPNVTGPSAEVSRFKSSLGATGSKRPVELWRREIGHCTVDVEYDAAECAIWVRTEDAEGYIWKYDLEGTLVNKMWTQPDLASICLDTKRNHLVLGSEPNIITTITKRNKVVSTFKIEEVGKMNDVTYDKIHDRLIVSDCPNRCLWFVDAATEVTLCRIPNDENAQDSNTKVPNFQCPNFLHFSAEYGPVPCILVADARCYAIHVLTIDGTFIKRYGIPGTGHGELRLPIGCCLDTRSRIVVCDRMNKRVVRFGTSPCQKDFEVIMTSPQLGGSQPLGMCIVNDSCLALTCRGDESHYIALYSLE